MARRPVTCSDCGHVFPVDPILTVACPTCHVPAGRNCIWPSGHPLMTNLRFHEARDLAAADAGAYEHEGCTAAAVARVQAGRQRRGHSLCPRCGRVHHPNYSC